jgi:AcrR family transcriptional regulator
MAPPAKARRDAADSALKPSLLSRQKIERRRAVLEAAKELIKTHGYDQTTMEGMANRAGLSTQTVYNYFGTKLDVLMELFIEDRDIADAKIRRLIDEGRSGPVDLLMAVLEADLHREVEAVNNALWRQVAAAEATSFGGKHHQIFQDMNRRYRDAVVEVFQQILQSGAFREDLDVMLAATLFLHISEALYRRIIDSANDTFAEIEPEARRQIELLVQAFVVSNGRGQA